MGFYLIGSRVMAGILGERFGRVVVAVVVAAMTTIGSLYLFTAGTRDRFEPLETASWPPSEELALPQPGLPQESLGETTEEAVAPAPEPVAELTRLRHAMPIADYLSRAGLNVFEAERWANAFRSAAHGRILSRGHLVSLERDAQTGQLRGLRYEVDERAEIVEKTLGNGVIVATQQPIRYKVETDSAAFAIKDSLEADAARHRIPKPIIERLVEAFGSRPRGDQQRATGLKVVYQQYVSPDGAHRVVGDVQAAELQTRTKTLHAFAFRDSYGRSHLYDEHGKPLGQRFLRYPVPFEYVSSGFSHARYHPILHYYRQHVGVDLVARYGTPVKAVADGRVEFADWGGELGRCVRLEHDHGLVSIYGHLSKISHAVSGGAYVSVGQVIGWVGTSGLSTGPHLHFGLMKNGTYVNPLTARLDSGGSEISPRMHGVFEGIKHEYQTVLSRLSQTGDVVMAKVGLKHPASSKAAVGGATAARVTNVFSAQVRADDGVTAPKPDGQSMAGAL
jgi:hypothetical protein